MIERRLLDLVRQRLREFPAVALLGPRQVGKTTLAHQFVDTLTPAPDVLDLENPTDAARLSDPLTFLRSRGDRLVVIDEVQRAPGLFQVLRGLIDERVRGGEPAGHYLLLGSASIDLLRQSSESLAGRIAYLELPTLDALEVHDTPLDELWVRGGFPRSLLAPGDDASAAWRANFITTYLERDIPQLGPRVPAETLRRFWTMLAHRQAAALNSSELARSLGVSHNTIGNYLDLLVDLLLVRRLQPLHANVGKRLVKSPRTWVRDSGLVHTLLRLDTLDDVLGHPIAGASWEAFVIENLIAVAPPRTDATWYRTSGGAEVDLVLDLPGRRRWVVEVKRSSAPRVSRGFHSAIDDLAPERAFVVHAGDDAWPLSPRVEAVPLRGLMVELLGVARGG